MSGQEMIGNCLLSKFVTVVACIDHLDVPIVMAHVLR